MNNNVLTRGSKINCVDDAVWFGTPNGSNPKGIFDSEGMRIPTQAIRPRLSRMPLIQTKRAMGLSHACVTMKDGYTDFASVGIRLPISVARANV